MYENFSERLSLSKKAEWPFLTKFAPRCCALAALAHLRGEKCFFSRTWKAPKRRRWRMKRGAFEAAPRLAGVSAPGNRLAQR